MEEANFIIDSLYFSIEWVWFLVWGVVELIIVGFTSFMIQFACSLIELLPFEAIGAFSQAVEVSGRIVAVLDVYIPLAEITAVFVTVYGFVGVVYLIRLIIKLIPTIG